MNKIDWVKVAQYLKAQCSISEICAVLDIDYEAAKQQCKAATGKTLPEYIAHYQSAGSAMLKLWMFKEAAQGDMSMAKAIAQKIPEKKSGKDRCFGK